MKKIITAILAAAMLFSVCACSDSDSAAESSKNTEVITVDDINKIIDTAKKDYAESDEVKLSDGTIVPAQFKDPSITIDDVKNGTVTPEQKNSFMIYMSNIRKIVYDRLSVAYSDKNHIALESEDGKPESFLFLDPAADGYSNVAEVLSYMNRGTGRVLTDYVYMNQSMVILFKKGDETPHYLCPTKEENALLTEIMK